MQVTFKLKKAHTNWG
jgi:hypothetical protein